MSEIYGERRLLCPAAGRVLPLQELYGGENPRRYSGEGFAVSAAGGFAGFLLGRLPAAEIHAPADGAVISVREDNTGFTLRTGDCLALAVELCAPAEFLKQVGDMARAGECVCRMSQEQFRSAPAVVVTFPDSGRITELHVHSGVRFAGQTAVEYRILGI
ncbi:MAG: hypothetical protein ACI4WS_07880 [Oscillospiraceae bacterium]